MSNPIANPIIIGPNLAQTAIFAFSEGASIAVTFADTNTIVNGNIGTTSILGLAAITDPYTPGIPVPNVYTGPVPPASTIDEELGTAIGQANDALPIILDISSTLNSGLSLTKGVYSVTLTAAILNTQLILDWQNDATSFWIFNITPGSLSFLTGASITYLDPPFLPGQLPPECAPIFWNVATSVTINVPPTPSGVTFELPGTVMAYTGGIAVSNPVISGPLLTYGTQVTFAGGQSTVSACPDRTIPCFNEGSQILTIIEGKEEYIKIENLEVGNMVKTYIHGNRKIVSIGKGLFKNDIDNPLKCMYKLEKSDEMTDDLIVTGGHAILVDTLTIEEKLANMKFYGINQEHIIDDKYLLLACCSDRFKQIQEVKYFTYYHLVLEEEDADKQFGIWANGILAETISKNSFLKYNLKA